MDKTVKINPDKLYTKTAYHKEFGTDRKTIDRMIKREDLLILKVKGTTLIRVK
jgi:hypothetical protein